MAPASVLVIDPHPMMREALCAAISLEPDLDLVEPDASGELTLSVLQEPLFLSQTPDLILLAMGNHDLEDLKSLEAIRSQLPGVVILALIPSEAPGQERAALTAGADAVLSKSASRDSLLGALRDLWMTALLKRGEETTDVYPDANLDEEARRG